YYRKGNPFIYKVIILNVIEIVDSAIHEYNLVDYINSEAMTIHYKKLNKNGIGEHFNNCIKKLLTAPAALTGNSKVSKDDLILNFFNVKLNSFKIFNEVLCEIDTS